MEKIKLKSKEKLEQKSASERGGTLMTMVAHAITLITQNEKKISKAWHYLIRKKTTLLQECLPK